jgi:hypothetical protein
MEKSVRLGHRISGWTGRLNRKATTMIWKSDSPFFVHLKRASVVVILMTIVVQRSLAQSPPVAAVRQKTVNMMLMDKRGGTVKQYIAKLQGSMTVDTNRRVTGLNGTIVSLESSGGKAVSITKTEIRDGTIVITTKEGIAYTIYGLNHNLVGNIRVIRAASPAATQSAKSGAIRRGAPATSEVGASAKVTSAAQTGGVTDGGNRVANSPPPATSLPPAEPENRTELDTKLPRQGGTLHYPGPLQLLVDAVAVGRTFQVYVGGGTNISPPDTFGGGGGIPLISMSDGAAFMAGEISSKSDKVNLLRIMFTVTNSTPSVPDGQSVPPATSFKIGDVSLRIGAETVNDFLAVGYGSKLCAMSDTDRKKVTETVVAVSPGEERTLSFAFPIGADAKHGELRLRNSTPVPFDIESGHESGQETNNPANAADTKKASTQRAEEQKQPEGSPGFRVTASSI